MINLSQIPNTSKLKELRGQINTMVDEINGNQMVIGQVLNPKAKLSYRGASIGTPNITHWYTNQLFAVCMLGPNGVYVAQVFGCLLSSPSGITVDNKDIYSVDIDIPAVKLPNRTAEVSSFVTAASQGFTADDTHTIVNTGLQFGAIAQDSTGSTVVVTDTALNSSPSAIVLNRQELTVFPSDMSLKLSLRHIDYGPQS